MSIERLLEKKYGVRVTFAENPKTTTVNTNPSVIAGNNPNRLALVVINLSSNTVWIAPSSDVSSEKGIYLASGGGGVSFVFEEDFILPSLEWYAVASLADSAIYVLEVIEI